MTYTIEQASPPAGWLLKDADGRWQRTEHSVTCPDCNGAGSTVIQHRSGNPALETDKTCGRCGGEGEVVDEAEGEA